MASHRRQRTPKARNKLQDPTLQVAEPRLAPREDGKPKPRDVLSVVADSEFEAEIDRFLDSLR
jgi:hypothetical protein